MKIKMTLTHTDYKDVILQILRRLATMQGVDREFGICRNLDEAICEHTEEVCGYEVVADFFGTLTGCFSVYPFKNNGWRPNWVDRSIWCGLMADAYENNGEFEVTEEQAAMLRNEISKKVIVCNE